MCQLVSNNQDQCMNNIYFFRPKILRIVLWWSLVLDFRKFDQWKHSYEIEYEQK